MADSGNLMAVRAVHHAVNAVHEFNQNLLPAGALSPRAVGQMTLPPVRVVKHNRMG